MNPLNPCIPITIRSGKKNQHKSDALQCVSTLKKTQKLSILEPENLFTNKASVFP